VVAHTTAHYSILPLNHHRPHGNDGTARIVRPHKAEMR
jgi:hypothetical protein